MSDEKKRIKFDYHSPKVRALVDQVVHGTFVRQGTMIAFPAGFPGAAIPIPSDESHITALDVTPEGIVYGGTSGRRAHIFVGMFHGVTGMIFDLQAVEGASRCAAVCCGKTKLLAAVNGPDGGRILLTKIQPLPYDLIQEWGFKRPPFEDLGEAVAGEPVVHAVADASRERVVGITTRHIFAVDLETSKGLVIGEVSGVGRLGVGSRGGIFGLEGTTHLWRFNPQTQTLERRAIALPKGSWGKSSPVWARDARHGVLYTADDDGNLFSLDEARGFSRSLGKTPLAPVGAMAVTLDGRVFGFCGSEIANLFCYDPARGDVSNLGVAVSVFERRRYGYVFGDAVAGRDGEIIFGEDDDLGHLWLYFPRIGAISIS